MEAYDLCRKKVRIYRGFSNNRSQGNIGNLGSHEEVVLDHIMFMYRGFSNNPPQGNIGNLGSHEEVVLDHVMFYIQRFYFENFLASLDQ